MQEEIQRARSIIEGLALGQQIKDELLERLESYVEVGSDKLEDYLEQIEVLGDWEKRLEIQARVGDLHDCYEESVEVVKKQILDILREEKGREEEAKIEQLQEQIRNFPSGGGR